MKKQKKTTVLIPMFVSGTLLTTVFVGNSFVADNNVDQTVQTSSLSAVSHNNSVAPPTTEELVSEVQALQFSANTKRNTETATTDTNTKINVVNTDVASVDVVNVDRDNVNVTADVEPDNAYINYLGTWYSDYYDDANKLVSSLSIEVEQISSTAIQGNYCFISNYGGKENCLIPFTGTMIADGNYTIDFVSHFDNKKNQAQLEFSTSNSVQKNDVVSTKPTDTRSLIWRVTPQTISDIGISNTSTLVLSEPESVNPINNAYIVNTQQAFIYEQPTETAKTEAYFIEDDVVEALEKKAHWIAVSYKNNDKKGWLKVDDLAKDRF